MYVLKFGGSSVGTAGRIKNVLHLIAQRAVKGHPLCVVFSAYQGVTDQLIRMGRMAERGDEAYKALFAQLEERHIKTADELVSLNSRSSILTQLKIILNDLEEILYGVFLVRELTAKTLDYIQSFGERLSCFTISGCLNDLGVNNEYVDSRTVVKTDDQFGKARVQFEKTEQKIREKISGDVPVYVVTGFIGSTDLDETTTLGRGGSDFSASIFGAALGAEEIEIWTDVDGVMTADPTKVTDAFSIAEMTYEEAMELSHFGARVIHPPTMQPALDRNLPIRILNAFNPDFKGTVIRDQSVPNNYIIKGISSIDSVALLQIRGSGMIGSTGIAERIFHALARNKINIILISQASSEHSICLAILPEASEKAVKALREELKYEIHYDLVNEIAVEPEMAIIAVVGENMRHRKGIAGKVFQTLGQNGINISAIAQGSSELNISMVIARNDETKALNALHRAFFAAYKKTLHIFLVGTGLVGKEFLKQLGERTAAEKTGKKVRLRLAGICNTRHMAIDPGGIHPDQWAEELAGKGSPADLATFMDRIKEYALPDTVVADCTSSRDVTEFYPGLLNSAISVVTPNKIANTRDMEFYKKLMDSAYEGDAGYGYETTVGASLPVIRTIKSMNDAGDRITKVEAVLSGTLSYLFNSYDGTVPFADLVLQARQMGYTEPDPRSDLSGSDVVKKLLIIIREMGTSMEAEGIGRVDFLPQEVTEAQSIDAFYKVLREKEGFFRDKYRNAKDANCVLRYVARYQDGRASVSLEALPQSHPFAGLQGSENIVALTSRFYHTYPLVIRGPGAGAEVTASGVLSDILQIGAVRS